jgi:hypothetical protein
MVGPSSTFAPFVRASSPIAAPTRSTSAVFQVAASAVPHGNEAEVGPSARLVPRAPEGPSDSTSEGMPSRAIGTVCQRSAPAVSEAFSSSESCASSSSTLRDSSIARQRITQESVACPARARCAARS